ncbi:hypothetical protein BTN50_0029 [Candidatus Enterovibrio altilux]|uniref:Uncharacterized protein n=1 Tax=Candidatus Enterovibrio altilux TaxID=1927128 RepID=A0A291B6E9_9GAMM|nr:hypothetical protein BTN50_0029 [Candidatus Enterovibrio luxaltus]
MRKIFVRVKAVLDIYVLDAQPKFLDPKKIFFSKIVVCKALIL